MINIRDLRKFIFVNSQSCIYYIDRNDTVYAGILRNLGYKYAGRQSEEVFKKIEKEYRNTLTVLNSVFAVEIILYIYLFVFPFYTSIFELPFFVAIFILAAIPMIALYLTYIIFNHKYELFLTKNIGQFKAVKFSPNIYNVEPKAYEKYLNTPRKTIYAVILVLLFFVFYAFTPLCIDFLNTNNKFSAVIKLSKIYLKFVPINSDVYAQRAYANYKLKHYKEAIYNYEMANKYSFSNSFDFEILGSKIQFLQKSDALSEFDKHINSEEEENLKNFLKSQKAVYLQKNRDYKGALDIYNELLTGYETKQFNGFAADTMYFNRGIVKNALGDSIGAASDKRKARTMCTDCSFDAELSLVQRP